MTGAGDRTAIKQRIKQYLGYSSTNSIKNRLIRGSAWSLVGMVLSNGIALVGTVIMARIMGAKMFGELGMIRNTIETVGQVIGLSVGLVATKFIAEHRVNNKDRAGSILGFSLLVALLTGLLGSLLTFVFADLLAAKTFNAPYLADELRTAAVLIVFNIQLGAQQGALGGFESFKVIAKVNFIGMLFYVPIMVFGAWSGGVHGAVIALVAATVVQMAVSRYALSQEARRFGIPITYKHAFRELPLIWRFALPSVGNGWMLGLVRWYGNVFVANQPNGFAALGIYEVANRWGRYLLMLPSLLEKVIIPVLSERFSDNDASGIKKTLKLSILVNVIVTVPVAFGLSVFSRQIMAFYGVEFESGWLLLIIVLFTSSLIAINSPLGQVVVATGRMWIGFTMNFGWTVSFLVSLYILREHGALGLGSAFLVAYILHSMWTGFFVWKIMRK